MVNGCRVVNEAEVDVFLEFSCFFYDPVDVGSLTSDSSASSKSSLNIWKFSIHLLLKPSLSITLLACEWVQLCGSLNILWHCCSLGLEWKLIFSSPVTFCTLLQKVFLIKMRVNMKLAFHVFLLSKFITLCILFSHAWQQQLCHVFCSFIVCNRSNSHTYYSSMARCRYPRDGTWNLGFLYYSLRVTKYP